MQSACRKCSSSIDHQPDETILICSACGACMNRDWHDNTLTPGPRNRFLMKLGVDQDQAMELVREWMSKGFFKAADLHKRASDVRADGFLLPIWVVRADVDVDWKGSITTTRRSGDRTITETKPTSGSYHHQYSWIVQARLSSSDVWGMDALKPGGLSERPDWDGFFLGGRLGKLESEGVDLLGHSELFEFSAEEFKLQNLSDLEVMHGQIAEAQAIEQAENEIAKLQDKKAVEMAGGSKCYVSHETRTTIDGIDLTQVPLWLVGYRYRGKPYRVLVNGNQSEILAGEHPVGKWDKVVVGLLATIVLAILVAILSFVVDCPEFLYVAAGLFLIPLGHAIKTALAR